MPFSDYFYKEFPEIIKDYYFDTRERMQGANSSENTTCDITEVGILIEEKDIKRYSDLSFWYCWYFVNLLEQIICRHFKNNFDGWINEIGRFPTPYSKSEDAKGNEIFQKEKPYYILEKVSIPFKPKKWEDACKFFLKIIHYYLEDKANIRTSVFLSELLIDKNFNAPANKHETTLNELINAMLM